MTISFVDCRFYTAEDVEIIIKLHGAFSVEHIISILLEGKAKGKLSAYLKILKECDSRYWKEVEHLISLL